MPCHFVNMNSVRKAVNISFVAALFGCSLCLWFCDKVWCEFLILWFTIHAKDTIFTHSTPSSRHSSQARTNLCPISLQLWLTACWVMHSKHLNLQWLLTFKTDPSNDKWHLPFPYTRQACLNALNTLHRLLESLLTCCSPWQVVNSHRHGKRSIKSFNAGTVSFFYHCLF